MGINLRWPLICNDDVIDVRSLGFWATAVEVVTDQYVC